jgi:predicted ATPase
MAVIERATLEMKRQHNHFYEAEMARLQGEILLAQSRDNAAQAEAGFRHAVTVAAQQSCRALGLRAATSLAQLLMDTGRAAEARDVLAPIYGAFTEGFGQSHVKAAKVMLAKLN